MDEPFEAHVDAPAITLPGNRPIADELYDYLRHAIIRGELAEGIRVVEGDIATRANVSRTPAGQALRRLQSDGLLRASQHGLLVNELSADELSETCTVRDSLEALAARLAASTRTDLDVALLEELTERFEAAIGGDVSEIVELNHAFHDAVWDAARNSALRRFLLQTRSLIERLNSTTLSSEARQRQALDEHRAILAAIAARDADTAESVALQHFHKATAIRILSKRVRTRTNPTAG
ncbi:GntR family transcriptional regulator [Streptosporangium canum]|uniref:Transcriptional regulator, GntR family n=1 Tax=Streptosporangium canum TaxID=324952 RepID=A0A1I4F7X6_9ACTN|nr:GntR family transcriptional regulator [Streptosporangium canum]SFL14085.1 transcriptional regulator, GntR family [Streptosporangium canum]